MATLVLDNFNRADNPTVLGTATSGQVWTTEQGVWGIVSNQAFTNVELTGGGIATIESGSPNGIAQVTINNASAGGGLSTLNYGIFFRYVDLNNWFLISYSANANALRLCRNIAGTVDGALAPANSVTWNDGDVMKVAYCNNHIVGYQNDIEVWDVTVSGSLLLAGTKCGLWAGTGIVSPNENDLFEDFLVITDDACGSNAAWVLPPLEWTAEATVETPPPVGGMATKRFDAGTGNSYWLLPQLSDSGIELRDKVVKAVRITGKVTDAAFKVYGYGATEELNIASMEAGTNSRTGAVAIPDSTGVKSTQRYQVNVPGSALHTVRIEGEWGGDDIKDRVDEVIVELAEQGARR
jgi:hypothetical protein